MKSRQIFDDVIACDLWFRPPQSKIPATPLNWRLPGKLFWRPFFLENTCGCVLGPWPWPRTFLSLASKGSVLGKAVLGLGLGLGFFLCPWPWPWPRALCPRLHLCWLMHYVNKKARCGPEIATFRTKTLHFLRVIRLNWLAKIELRGTRRPWSSILLVSYKLLLSAKNAKKKLKLKKQ